MALSKCPKCESHRFEIKENEPAGAYYKQVFIQCTSCGTVVGTTGFYDAGSLLKQQEKAIAGLHNEISNLKYAVGQIAHSIEQIARKQR